ncbi:MAG: glycosyltransferase family 39 protein [Chloroflexi bacterium]|nr:glycosyltransferase family 39 protein [Chloroflexota bacterium]
MAIVRDWLCNRTTQQWLGIILGLHFALGVFYSVIVPAWESYDEPAHYQYVQYIILNRSLPDVIRTPEKPQIDLREYTQPPLYYFLGALTTFWVDTTDHLDLERNPHVFGGRGGKNFAVHSGEDGFPYRSTFLALHLIRLFSVVIGTLAVWATYLLASNLFRHNPQIALGATAITAFSPQMLFMGSVINNDILVTLFSSLFLLYCVRVVAGQQGARDVLGLGFFLGLALMSKYNALALLPLALLALASALWRRVRLQRRNVLSGLALLLGALLLPLGLWFIPGTPLYGGPLRRFAAVIGSFLEKAGDPIDFFTSLHWDFLPNSILTAFNSYWLLFGWANIYADDWVYLLLGLFVLLGAIGILASLPRQSSTIRLAIFLFLFLIALFVGINFYRSLRSGVNPPVGRYMLPTISAVSILLALGLSHWAGRWPRIRLNLIFGVGLFLLASLSPFLYILPAYAPPPLITAEQRGEISNPYAVNFGDRIQLLGYDLDTSRARPGGEVIITLYLRGEAEMSENYTMALHLLDPDQQPYTKIDTYPGGGNYATSLWEPGQILRDTYQITIPSDFPAPTYGQIKLAFILYRTGEEVPSPRALPLGESVLLPRFPIRGTKPPQVQNPVFFSLGDSFRLIGYEIPESISPGQSLELTLFWESIKPTAIDYQVFIHLVDAQGNVLAQGDGPPRNGFYPTSLWSPGEIIEDTHLILLPAEIPAGEYQLKVGMYRLDTLERLPVSSEGGQRISNDEVIIPGISVE